jgi:hypothetical protein
MIQYIIEPLKPPETRQASCTGCHATEHTYTQHKQGGLNIDPYANYKLTHLSVVALESAHFAPAAADVEHFQLEVARAGGEPVAVRTPVAAQDRVLMRLDRAAITGENLNKMEKYRPEAVITPPPHTHTHTHTHQVAHLTGSGERGSQSRTELSLPPERTRERVGCQAAHRTSLRWPTRRVSGASLRSQSQILSSPSSLHAQQSAAHERVNHSHPHEMSIHRRDVVHNCQCTRNISRLPGRDEL